MRGERSARPRTLGLVPLLVRTWNLFHGNANPPERRGFLKEMISLVTADDPDVVCLQEVPVWALDGLAGWSGMRSFGAVARRPTIGPLPATPRLGRRLTRIDPARLRSAFTGQANAVLVSRRLRAAAAGAVVLNAAAFRRAQARWLRLPIDMRIAWSQERRVCHAVRVNLPDGASALVGNLHATAYDPDERLADAELLRAAWFLSGIAGPDEPMLLCGDLNVTFARSRTQLDLTGPEWGFSRPRAGIDQVLVRGCPARAAVRWPDERRHLDGRLLSDHAPVEVAVG
jgi:endonuclease/exonuclease/phosphatase family metal-dependent hydrolase